MARSRVFGVVLAWLLFSGCASDPPELFSGNLGNGECAITDEGRIECSSCRPGWQGKRCNVCVDPRRCGSRPRYADRGVVTRYHRAEPATAWLSGVFPLTVPYREIQELDPIDNDHERREDARRGVENRFGVVRSLPDPLAASAWHSDSEGRRFWTRGYRSRGAESMSLVLRGIRLSREAELWVYSERSVHGPVRAEDIRRGVHGTPPLWGDVLYLEIRDPASPGGATEIEELTVVHSHGGGGGPVACEVDAACFPTAENQANGVAAMYIHSGAGTFWCSASLLNTAGEGGPLLLTAEHCLWEDKDEYTEYILDPDQPNPAGMVDFDSATFVFHYRNQSCDPPGQDDENDIWNALSYTGATIELHDHETDIAVLELDQTPDPQCVTYLGFDSSTPPAMPSYTAGISHPDGLLARIHVDWDPPTLSDYMDEDDEIADSYLEDDTFYRQVLGAGDYGWPQGGSSGSPLFDPTGRVVGQLSGHWPASGATCSSGVGWMYGRLSKSDTINLALGGLLGASEVDAAGDTATRAVPLFDSNLAPCVNNSYWYTINPRVADGFDVSWELGGPGANDAEILEVSADGRQARIVFTGSGNPVPYVRLEITVSNPCYEDRRDVRLEPTFCI